MREAHMLYAILGPELTSDFVRTVENGDPEHTENLRDIAKKLSDLNVRKKPPVMLIAMASAMWALTYRPHPRDLNNLENLIHFFQESDPFPALTEASSFAFKYLGDEVLNALERFGVERPPARGDDSYNNWVRDSVESIWDDFGWF